MVVGPTLEVPPRDGVVAHRLLGDGTLGALCHLWRRLSGPLSTVRRAGRDPLVVVWTRDPWDAALFVARSRLGRPVLFIAHNPIDEGRRGGWAGRLERALLRSATVVCVHSDGLAEVVRPQVSRRVAVTPHPSYAGMVEALGPQPAVVQRAADRIALVGSLRRDKGAELIPGLMKGVAPGAKLVVLGGDRLPPDTEAQLVAAGVQVAYPAHGPLSGQALVTGMRESTVMLAPYRDVTASGSVILAITAGLPVLGLASAPLARLLTAGSCAEDAARLAQLLTAYLRDPWETHRLSAEGFDQASAAGWRTALRSVAPSSRSQHP